MIIMMMIMIMVMVMVMVMKVMMSIIIVIADWNHDNTWSYDIIQVPDVLIRLQAMPVCLHLKTDSAPLQSYDFDSVGRGHFRSERMVAGKGKTTEAYGSLGPGSLANQQVKNISWCT